MRKLVSFFIIIAIVVLGAIVLGMTTTNATSDQQRISATNSTTVCDGYVAEDLIHDILAKSTNEFDEFGFVAAIATTPNDSVGVYRIAVATEDEISMNRVATLFDSGINRNQIANCTTQIEATRTKLDDQGVTANAANNIDVQGVTYQEYGWIALKLPTVATNLDLAGHSSTDNCATRWEHSRA